MKKDIIGIANKFCNIFTLLWLLNYVLWQVVISDNLKYLPKFILGVNTNDNKLYNLEHVFSFLMIF